SSLKQREKLKSTKRESDNKSFESLSALERIRWLSDLKEKRQMQRIKRDLLVNEPSSPFLEKLEEDEFCVYSETDNSGNSEPGENNRNISKYNDNDNKNSNDSNNADNIKDNNHAIENTLAKLEGDI